MINQNIREELHSLLGFNIGIITDDKTVHKGVVLDVKGDFIVIRTESNKLYYFNLNQIHALSKDTKEFQPQTLVDEPSQKQSLLDVINGLKHRWVTVSRDNNLSFDGFLGTVTDGYIVLLNKDQQLYVQLSDIIYIFEGTADEGSEDKQQENKNEKSDNQQSETEQSKESDAAVKEEPAEQGEEQSAVQSEVNKDQSNEKNKKQKSSEKKKKEAKGEKSSETNKKDTEEAVQESLAAADSGSQDGQSAIQNKVSEKIKRIEKRYYELMNPAGKNSGTEYDSLAKFAERIHGKWKAKRSKP